MRRLNYIVLLIAVIFVGCDEIEDACTEEKFASAIIYDFPDSLLISENHFVQINFIAENSCGEFADFEINEVSSNVTEVKIKMLYEGCNCALEFTEDSVNFPITLDSAGIYYFKFYNGDSGFDTYQLTAYE